MASARVTLRDGLLALSITGRETVVIGRAGDDAADAVDRQIVSIGLARVTPPPVLHRLAPGVLGSVRAPVPVPMPQEEGPPCLI